MRRRRKIRTKLGVSLFPFLAVLICTLGVLIVLLVLAVRSADVRATVAHIDHQESLDRLAERESELRELQSQIDLRAMQLDGLTDMRPEVLKRMSAVREHRGHLEQEIRELTKKQTQLSRQLLALESEPSADRDSPASDERLIELESKIDAAKKQLAEKRLEAKTVGPVTYSIVPHAGSGGTFRRPIFIECTSDALVIQPLNIRLPKSEFAPPLGAGNMLDAALLAIRDYWQQYDLSGSEGTPYPLLVVRPGGAETYVIARRAMASWDDEFGYELVESEKQLDFGEKDQQLADRVAIAIADAKQRQQFVASFAPVRGGSSGGQAQYAVGPGKRSGGFGSSSNSRPGLTVSSSSGGFVSNAGWERVKREEQESQFENGNSLASSGSFESFNANQSPESGDWPSSNETDNGDGSTTASVATGPRTALETYTDAVPNSNNRNGQSGQHKSDSRSSDSNSNSARSAGEAGGSEASGVSSPLAEMSLAKKRGENWALPTQTPGATGYVRPIRLVCGPQVLEVRSALGVEKRIPIGDDITESIDPLVNEIWRQIESWGLSGDRSYWKPELRISVLPGGELNFEKLSGLLLNSGVTVKESGQ